MTKKETRFTRLKRVPDQRSECSAEIILPDFYPDVRKILHVSAEPHPISVFAAGDGLECSGGVNFDVVYLDFDGAVCSVSFNGDYDFKLKSDTEKYKDSLMETKLAGVSLRLMSPRKIAAKAMLDNCVTILFDEEVSVSGDTLDESRSPELDTVSENFSLVAFSSSHEREYAESVCRLDGKIVDEVSVIHTSVVPSITHINKVDDGAEISGKLDVTLLIKTDESHLYRLEKSIDITEKISMPDVKNDSDLRAVIDIASVTANINGDEAGVEIVLNVVTETRLICEGNETLDLVCDAYLCDVECNNTYSELCFDHYLGKLACKGEIDESVSLQSLDVGKLREVVYSSSVLHIEDCSFDGDNIAIAGKIQTSCIASEIKDDGSTEFVPLKFITEFKQNVNYACQNPDKIKIIPNIKLINASVAVDFNSAYLRADAEILCSVFEERNLRVLNCSNISYDSKVEHSKSRIVVYYPTNSDTLYSIAKSYHTTKERLILDNPQIVEVSSDGGDALSKIKKLIIT